jgi:hypothetical protein
VTIIDPREVALPSAQHWHEAGIVLPRAIRSGISADRHWRLGDVSGVAQTLSPGRGPGALPP